MSVAPLASTRPQHPYPGLRPFEANEWSIFFGRERMIDEVIERLARDRLVVIHGASGSGKSSLVRAGVMPKLARQHLRHGAAWLTSALRPSGGPLWNLAAEFARLEQRAEDLARIETIHGLFNRRDATLASVAGELDGVAGKSLCVLVDQFEELFRYEKETSREEAELFVDLIGRAEKALDGEPSRATVDVHVIVTMRSEFLGECARFDGLAETINRTQYLVPRMDDDALLRAVRRPALMFNGFVPEALAQRLVASVRGREDELPLLQHGLMLMWDAAARGKTAGRIELDGAMVEEAGGLAELLSGHADRVMDAAAPDAGRARIVEAMFRELTDVNAEGSAIRRPRSLRDLAAVAATTPDELRSLIEAFRKTGVSFLTPYPPAPLPENAIVDISHEALIRCWRRIADAGDGWLKREFDDGLAWRSLLVEASA
jgi:energy-coupling factor transporter ATP-binding protein EcfA2